VLALVHLLQVHFHPSLVVLVLVLRQLQLQLREMPSAHQGQRRALLLIRRQVRDQPLPSSSPRSS
jgi:hypothetical protein